MPDGHDVLNEQSIMECCQKKALEQNRFYECEQLGVAQQSEYVKFSRSEQKEPTEGSVAHLMLTRKDVGFPLRFTQMETENKAALMIFALVEKPGVKIEMQYLSRGSLTGWIYENSR